MTGVRVVILLQWKEYGSVKYHLNAYKSILVLNQT